MAEIAARIVESPALYRLLAPIRRLCGLDVPIPYAPQLETASVPQIDGDPSTPPDHAQGVLMARIPIRMPKMSMTMTEGEVAMWLVSVGDPVNEGDVICEVMTDKVDMEVESPAHRDHLEILVEAGTVGRRRAHRLHRGRGLRRPRRPVRPTTRRRPRNQAAEEPDRSPAGRRAP